MKILGLELDPAFSILNSPLLFLWHDRCISQRVKLVFQHKTEEFIKCH